MERLYYFSKTVHRNCLHDMAHEKSYDYAKSEIIGCYLPESVIIYKSRV